MRAGGLAAVLALGLTMAAAVPAAAEQRLETFDTPSRFVDIDNEPVGPPAKDRPPRANNLGVDVLLPKRYSARRKKRFPVLYVLHGAAQAYDHWAHPELGNIAELARGLDAIVVMPQGGAIGFYTDWFDGGARDRTRWESYYLRELVPLIERRYRVRPGRRWHAIAGLSMGGYGAMHLASQLPGYFGTAASFSGVLDSQDPDLDRVANLFFSHAWNRSYSQVFGPLDGFYAEAQNPTKLLENLRHTRLYASAGDGTPCPGDDELGQNFGGLGPQAGPQFNPPVSTAFAPALLIGLEHVTRKALDTFAAAAGAARLPVIVERPCGVHWWETFRRGFTGARERLGDFHGPVAERPVSWTYRSAARRGDAWGLRFSFAEPTTAVMTLRRQGSRLTGEGKGRVRIRRGSCAFTASLPFARRLPRRCR